MHSPNDFLFLFILCRMEEMQRKRQKHTRYQKKYYKSLDAVRRRLRDRRIPRVALQDPATCSWNRLYNSGNDQALITLTGLDFATFHWLERMFTPIHDNYSPFVSPDGRIVRINNNRGRKRLMNGKDCLALCLAWTRTRGSNMALQIIFGITATPLSMYLRFGRRILIKVLSNNDLARIQIPSPEKIREYCAAVESRHPNLRDVWCTMDGLKLLLQHAGDFNVQNNFYNGWTHDHYVSGVFCFCPDGTIPIACYNVPGSIHDSKIAEWGNIYEKLESVYQSTGAKCTADSAFSRARAPFIIKSSQMVPLENNNIRDYGRQIRINQDATSMRQSAEWGMRSLQSSFPRLKDRFIYEEYGERKLVQRMILLLYNLRARKVGINQIRSVYMPALDVNANDYFLNGNNIY